MHSFLLILNILGGLAIFLFGMKMMSDGLQKMAGNKMRLLLSRATNNRFSAMLSGICVTSIIQSSSAATVMVVGFTSAGLLTLNQALGVIFGANIGTTFTAWLVSLFGFKIQISLFALPVIALGFFGQFLPTRWALLRRCAETAVGFGLLFLGLDILKNTMPTDIAQHPWIAHLLSTLTPTHTLHLIALIGIGTLLTVLLQSSSAVMAMTLTLSAAGIISFPVACSLVLGENIGTTITANLAAAQASNNAKRAAIGHFLFNFFGVVWVSLLFSPFIHIVDWLVPGNPYGSEPSVLTSVLPYHISAFHTLFNVINTLIMLPLLRPLANLTMYLIPKTKRENQVQEGTLVYLHTHLMQTPELALLAAREESQRMMELVSRMTEKLVYLFKTTEDKMLERLISDIQICEQNTDSLEHQINSYLTQLTHGNLSRHAVSQTIGLFDLTGCIESMADCGEKIASLFDKFHNQLDTQDKKHLEQMAQKTRDVVKQTALSLSLLATSSFTDTQWKQAHQNEEELNQLRRTLRQIRAQRISQGYMPSAISITVYGDILNNFERIGDYAFRCVEGALHSSAKK